MNYLPTEDSHKMKSSVLQIFVFAISIVLVVSFEVENRDDESEDNNFKDISGNFVKFFPSVTIFF